MRRYYEHENRLICVDIPSTLKPALYQEVLAREKAAEAKLITREDWSAKFAQRTKLGLKVEWFDDRGSF